MTNSSMPWAEHIFMMCQRIGLPPISTIGLGLRCVSSLRRVPSPPARITAFMRTSGAPEGARLALVLAHVLDCQDGRWAALRHAHVRA